MLLRYNPVWVLLEGNMAPLAVLAATGICLIIHDSECNRVGAQPDLAHS